MKNLLAILLIVLSGNSIAVGQTVPPESPVPVGVQLLNEGAASYKASAATFLLPEYIWNIAYSLKDEILPEGYHYTPLTLLGNFTLMPLGPLDLYAESQVGSGGNAYRG